MSDALVTSATKVLFDNGSSYGSKQGAPPNDSTLIYSLSFTGDTPNNMSSGDPMPNGGYIEFLGNNVNGAGAGWGTTNITTVDVTDPAHGSVKALRNTYFANKAKYSFGNQTLFIKHPEMAKFYMSMRIRWSDNWEWGDDQLKFCKNTAAGTAVSTNCPKFDGQGDAYVTRLAPVNPALNDQAVNAVAKFSQGDYRTTDDIINNFGGDGIDANWTPILGQWYTIEWEIDAVSAGATNGYHKIWIDNNLYFEKSGQISEVGDTLFTLHELGHVWQGSVDPTQDIYMDWHSIEVRDGRPL